MLEKKKKQIRSVITKLRFCMMFVFLFVTSKIVQRYVFSSMTQSNKVKRLKYIEYTVLILFGFVVIFIY